jgi:hypothetical protein
MKWKDVPISSHEMRESSENVEYSPYTMKDNSLFSYIIFVPAAVMHSLSNMAKVFGWKFIFSIFIVYGTQQGIANAWFFQARDYYFKDIAKVEPSDAQTYTAASMTPWNLKPIYGIASDSMPIFGLHRAPYIMIGGALGATCFALLSSIELHNILAVVLFFGINLSVASPGTSTYLSLSNYILVHSCLLM